MGSTSYRSMCRSAPSQRISFEVLTESVRDMERDGLVQRRVLTETPPQHVEYSLTPLGQTLREPLAAICAWATENGA